jgi:hypothetical protein
MRATPLRREDTKKRFETAVECAGYEVRDPLNERVGTEKQVSLNGAGEPEYIRVRMGTLGRKHILLPVQLVEVDDERHVSFSPP